MMMLTTMMINNSAPAPAAEATTGMRGKLGSVMTVLGGEVTEGITRESMCVCVCVCACAC